MKEYKLTENDQRIFEHIKRVVRTGCKPTCAQVARQVNAAPSSIVKLAQKMGYEGWNDMYYSLHQIHTEEVPLSIDNFNFLSHGRLFESTARLLELLLAYRDRSIVIACVGDSEFLGNYLLEKLWQRSFRACRYSEHLLESLQISGGEPGLCIFVNESGILLVDACIRFQALGYRVYAVTCGTETPLAGKADYAIEIQNKKSSVEAYLPNFFAARTLIFLELLFAEIDERFFRAD